jgi:hypothetical protein
VAWLQISNSPFCLPWMVGSSGSAHSYSRQPCLTTTQLWSRSVSHEEMARSHSMSCFSGQQRDCADERHTCPGTCRLVCAHTCMSAHRHLSPLRQASSILRRKTNQRMADAMTRVIVLTSCLGRCSFFGVVNLCPPTRSP